MSRVENEREIDDITAELKGLHGGKFGEPQFRLWARMVINGIHKSKETPPNIRMITGVTPTRASRPSIEDTMASAVATQQKLKGCFYYCVVVSVSSEGSLPYQHNYT